MGLSLRGKERRHSPFLQRIKQFTPAWYTINLGTAIVSLILFDLPYLKEYKTTQYIALILHLLNCLLWVAFTICSLLRYIRYPSTIRGLLKYADHGLFIGAFPMACAALILGSAIILYEDWSFGGETFTYILWSCWWIDVALSIFCCYGQLHMMITRQNMALETMTTIWMLPIVTLVMASSCGASLAKYLAPYNSNQAFYTVGICLCLVISGVVSAFMINTIYLHRLVIFGLPQSTSIYSAFLPVGAISQAAAALEKIGTVYSLVLPFESQGALLSTPNVSQLIEFICFTWAFALWAVATTWLIGAVVSFLDIFRQQHLPFKVTFWGLVFPNGSYASLTVRLGVVLDSNLFSVTGLVLSFVAIILWLVAVAFTGPGIWHGGAFQSPSILNSTEFSATSLKHTSLNVLHYESRASNCDSSFNHSRPSSVP